MDENGNFVIRTDYDPNGIQDDTISLANRVGNNFEDSILHYYVIANNHSDLESLYYELETEGISPANTDITRSVECVERRPSSRGTLYALTQSEVDSLINDERVLDIQPHPKHLGMEPVLNSTQQSSSNFNKSSTISNTYINWGLLRCTSEQQISNWGSGAYDYNTGYPGAAPAGSFSTTSGSIELTQTGRNVDFINLDDDGIAVAHPEYAVNPDGTGGSRFVSFNWYQYSPYVLGYSENPYFYPTAAANGTTYYNSTSYHPTHVSGTVAGNTQGFARDANIYHISYNTHDSSSTSYCFNYIKEFHNRKAINPNTGIKNPTIVNSSWGYQISSSIWNWARITGVYYRGVNYIGPVYAGYMGGQWAWYSSNWIENITWERTENYYYSFTDFGGYSVLYANTGATLLGSTGLTEYSTPTSGNTDIGYWQVNLPFPFRCGYSSTQTLYINTNQTITANAPFTVKTTSGQDYVDFNTLVNTLGLPVHSPPESVAVNPAWFWNSGNRSIQRVFHGLEGSAPNTVYRIRIESDYANTGVSIGQSGCISEWKFFQNTAGRIDINFGPNNAKIRQGTQFSIDQISNFGFPQLDKAPFNTGVPARISVVDADVEDILKNGIIHVGSAGNSNFKIDVPGGQDWNNTFELGNHYSSSIQYPIFYNQGASPNNHDSKSYGGNYDTMDNIVVGALDVTPYDSKAVFSNAGPGVDIWAPGVYIQSSTTKGVSSSLPDTRSSDSANNTIGKMSGTSMSAPQVTGILACALEIYPHMTPNTAKAYIINTAKVNQITDFTDPNSSRGYYALWGGPNRIVHYKRERPELGAVYPKANNQSRPVTGSVWPRPKIKKTQ